MRLDLPDWLFMRRLSFIFVLLIAIVGCRPTRPAAQIQIPTLASLPSPYQIEGAERIAREFLQNWHDSNFERMFELISFASQGATPHDEFIALYQSAHEAMRVESLFVTDNGIFRNNDLVAIFNYTVAFHSTIFGDFADLNRDLRLVVDERAQDWRVAWTPADIFPEMADGGHLRLDSIAPNRANIYDRNGRVLADQEGRVVTLNIVRQRIPDYDNCLNALSAALNQPTADVQTRLEARPMTELVQIGTIEEATYNATNAALGQFCDADFVGRRVRRYPYGVFGPVAPHILGYVGYPDETAIAELQQAGFTQDSIIGRSGVELYWDETLRGQPAFHLVIVAPTGEVLREIASTGAQPGQSLWLTLDIDFQETVTQIVADAYTQAKDGWGPGSPGASAVVIDVNTGEILAMVSYPSFDNNAYSAFPLMGRQEAGELIEEYLSDPSNPEINRPAQGLFSLGSVMKTVTATAAADSGVYDLDERYTCIGSWNRDITRYDWLEGGHGLLTLAGALTHSCNPYFYETGYNLFMADPWILPTYARRFGFGGFTGLEDIAEESGFIPDPDWFRTTRGYDMTFSDEVNMAVGQGELQVTPLQVARWFGALANGGTLWRPYLVREVGLLGEERLPAHNPEGTPINVQADVMATIQSGLCGVTTDPTGTATFVFEDSELQTIGVCGKTGTAQTGSPTTPSHAWFASWAPRDNPQIAVVVMVETAGEGSAIAAPIARQILEAYFGMTP